MSSAFDSVLTTVEDLVKTIDDDWEIRTAWPNVAFSPPQTGVWWAVSVLWGTGQVMTKNGRNTVAGVLSFAIRGNTGEGLGALTRQADTIRDVFSRVRSTGSAAHEPIKFGAPSGPQPAIISSFAEGGVRGAREGFAQVTVDVPFTLEELD